MKTLFIGAINISNSPKGGQEYKNQLIIQKLYETDVFQTTVIDTYKWKIKPWIIAKLFFSLIFTELDSILISASSASTFSLLKIIAKIKPAILHKTNYLVIGGYFPEGIKSKRYDWKIYENLKFVVVEGEILKDQLLSSSELKNIIVIPNFKNFEINLALKEKDITIYKFVFIGKMSKFKGIYEIIDAVRVLKSLNSALNFSVDFYGPLLEEIKLPKDLPLIYKGYLDIMNNQKISHEILSEYLCMLHPTYWMGEGFPGVIIDAYVAGLPVITTDWNMNKEVVEDGVTGIIIPIQDSSALAGAMLKMIENSELGATMSQNSMIKAKAYHIDVVWPEIEKLIF
jgi:glycosyltransferase involved in cell wall biosynthesis